MGAQIDSSGKVSYIDAQGDQGGAWNFITKHLPRGIAETFGEAITPSLNPVGGDLNARDYISQHAGLTNQGGESIPEALLKGAGEGALGLAVPKSSADLQGQALGLASGAALEGGLSARNAANAAQSGLAAREGARAKLKASGSDQYLPSSRAAQRQINTMDPGGVSNPAGKTPYRGPRPTEGDMTQFERGTGLDRGIPPRENPGLDASRTSARAYANRTDPVKGHQLKMAKYRMKREQMGEGLSKMKKEQLGEGVKKMKSEQISEGNTRELENQAVDKVQQDIAGRYLYDRARNAPVDAAGTAARNAPPPKPPREMPVMGTAEDLADVIQGEEQGRAAKQAGNLFNQLQGDQPGNSTFRGENAPGGGNSFIEYMQELLNRGQLSYEDFLGLMRAKAQETGITGPGGKGLPF